MITLLIILSGFLSVCAQTLLLREMLVVFQGNELSLGLMLSQWLLGVALGSFLASRPRGLGCLRPRTALPVSFLLAGLALPAALFWIRNLRLWLAVFPGEGLSLGTLFLGSAAALLPVSLLFGVQFVYGVRWAETEKRTLPAGTIYFAEALGYLAGGLVFTFGLIPRLHSMTIAGLLLAAGAVPLTFAARRPATRWGAAALVPLLVFLTVRFSPTLETLSLQRLFFRYTLQTVQNSPYGQQVVADKNDERYFFFDGEPQLTLPHPDTAKLEDSVDLPLLFRTQTAKALLIGGGGEYLETILRHPVQTLDYVEPDPWLIRLVRQFWPASAGRSPFTDPRLKIHAQDGRRFVRTTPLRFDAVFLGMPYPLTLSTNRFFTREFFLSVRSRLHPRGLFTLSLPGSLVYLPPAQAELTGVLEATLRSVFRYVTVLPAETNLFLASQGPIDDEAAKLGQRLARSRVPARFLSPAYLDFRLDPGKRAWLEQRLRQVRKTYGLNRDFHPRALLAALRYWQSIFSPRFGKFYAGLAGVAWVLWPLLLAGLGAGRIKAGATVFATGCVGMGLHLLAIWGLQVTSGSLYYWIGLMNAAFMAGLACGALVLRRFARLPATAGLLLKLEAGFFVWTAVWWLLLRIPHPPWPAFFALSVGSGFFVGLEFPAVVSFQTARTRVEESRSAGGLYAADVLGGWMAALLVGALLIPAWGLGRVLLLLLLAKAVSLTWWLRAGLKA